jgi:hypothetical protein
MTAFPRMSIVIPSFNQAGFLERALDSLAGISPLRVILLSPWFFMLTRSGRCGWRGLFKPLRPWTVFRFAGLSR